MNKQSINNLNRFVQQLSVTATLTISTLSGFVSAQDNRLEEITVTATRRAQTIQDIPYNISAMTAEQLEQAGVFSLADLSRNIPGVAFSDLGVRNGGVNNQIILRGINSNSQGSISAFLSNLNPAGVSTYMDDTPLFTNLRMNDLERVEVLRGPQGTLYGANSIGGTVRFIFNKPDPEAFSAKIDTGFGVVEDSDDLNYNVDGVVNILLGTTAALRISAGFEETAGFVDGNRIAVNGSRNSITLIDPTDPFGSGVLTEFQEDTDSAQQWYVRTSLLWEISDRFQAQLTYHHQDDDAKGISYQTNENVPGAQERTHSQYFNSPLTREVDLVSLELDYDLGFARLESSTSYTKNQDVNGGDVTGLIALTDFFAGGLAIGGFPTNYASMAGFYEDIREEESIVQEIRLVSQGESKIDWVAGFYYQDIDTKALEPLWLPGFANYANTPGYSGLPGSPFVPPVVGPFPLPPFLSFANILAGFPTFVPQSAIDDEIYFTVDRKVTVEDFALFGELTYHATDAWQVTVGARVFWNENSQNLINTFPLFGAIAAQDGIDPSGLNTSSGSNSEQDQVFKVNTSYEFNDDLKTYFTWAEGYRRGGSNAFPTAGFSAEDPSQRTYQADTVTNYEIGLKGVLFDRLRYTAALFRIDWDKPQISGTFLPGGYAAVFNAEEARSQGIELEGQWAVTDAMQLSFGYTYTDAELTADYAAPLGAGDLFPDVSGRDGEPLPGVPDSIVTWALDYVKPVNLFGPSELYFRVDGSYRSSVVTASSPTQAQFVELEGFAIWNASLNWSNDHWRVRAYVKNIGDEIGASQVFRDFAIARPLENTIDFISRPRTIGVMVGYTY